MTYSESVFSCPYCGHPFEAHAPDSWHSEYSYEEPPISNVRGELKKREFTCKNPKCNKQITLYWYAPVEFFRIV